MALQFRDGSFSETLPYDEALARFINLAPSGEVVALHVGTPSELEIVKRKAELSERLSDIENKFNTLDKRIADLEEPISDRIHIPTRKEVSAIMRRSDKGIIIP